MTVGENRKRDTSVVPGDFIIGEYADFKKLPSYIARIWIESLFCQFWMVVLILVLVLWIVIRNPGPVICKMEPTIRPEEIQEKMTELADMVQKHVRG